MKVLLDTSFLYSALFHPNPQFDAILDFIFVEHTVLIPEYVADEIVRKAIQRRPDALDAVYAFLQTARTDDISQNAVPDSQITIRDINDQPILDAAIHHDVDIIISSDKDFTTLEIERPRIMKPREFYDVFISS